MEDNLRITIRRGAVAGLATLGLTALLAGCAAAPAQTPATSAGPAVANFLPCMVSDSGGFDDKSFNQSGFEGLNAASKTLGVTPKTVQSAAVTDFAPNLTNLVAEKCNLIVTVGFLLADATKASATADPSVNYTIVDDSSIALPNVKPIVFDTAQAAFLAGYTAASYSKTGIVGTYGGLAIPPVTIYHEVDNTYFSADSSSFIGEVYASFGLENIADRAEGDNFGFPQLNVESIISANPEVIFVPCGNFCTTTADEVAARPGWDAIAAVQNGNVIEADEDIASRWGPRIVEYYEAVAAIVAGLQVPA